MTLSEKSILAGCYGLPAMMLIALAIMWGLRKEKPSPPPSDTSKAFDTTPIYPLIVRPSSPAKPPQVKFSGVR